MAPQNQENSRLQNLLNSYQRDKFFIEQQHQMRTRDIQNRLLILSRQPHNTGEQTRNLILELGYLNEEMRKEIDKINTKIENTRREMLM
jgi:hypothetical protein